MMPSTIKAVANTAAEAQEWSAAIAANLGALAFTVTAWSETEMALKVVALAGNIVIAAISVVWLVGKIKLNKLERDAKRLEIEQLRQEVFPELAEEPAQGEGGAVNPLEELAD